MDEVTLLMGKPLSYWQELEEQANNLGVTHLIEELQEANAKVRYYERMLDRIEIYRKKGVK